MRPDLGNRDHLFVDANGRLLIDGVDTIELVRKFGSPLYVMSAERLRKNYRGFENAFKSMYDKVLICFAYKANSHLAVCKLLKDEGAGAEVASGGELHVALRAGVSPEKIVFDGPNKTPEELRTAIDTEVGLINADSTTEIKRIGRVAAQVGKKPTIGVRVNPDIPAATHPHLATGLREHKFGVWIEEAFDAYELASKEKNINVAGVLAHIGSDIPSVEPFRDSVSRILDLIGDLRDKLGLEISLIDLGGGLGIPYSPSEVHTSTSEYAHIITSSIRDHARERGLPLPTLILEPGRAIAGDAGILLTTVGIVKETARRNWAIVDAGMNLLLRPALYEAYHHVIVANKASKPSAARYSIGGPCCESGDYLAKDRELPKLAEGDLLAVLDTGAYGFTMSSHYNSYPRCAVVMVENGVGRLIRSRETYEDLLRNETL
mgnify:CR=1 FL=1